MYDYDVVIDHLPSDLHGSMAGWLLSTGLDWTGIYLAKNYEIREETLRISGTVSTTKQHNYE